MTDTIAKRLRNRREMVDMGHGNVIDVPDEDCVEAADEIDRLLDENRKMNTTITKDAVKIIQLRDEIERLKTLSQNNARSWDAIVHERDELRIEYEAARDGIERLTAELTEAQRVWHRR
jgi:predicted RNase H-like nuclease (RuvC/YqgF family)